MEVNINFRYSTMNKLDLELIDVIEGYVSDTRLKNCCQRELRNSGKLPYETVGAYLEDTPEERAAKFSKTPDFGRKSFKLLEAAILEFLGDNAKQHSNSESPIYAQDLELTDLVHEFSDNKNLVRSFLLHINSGKKLPIKTVGDYLSQMKHIREKKFRNALSLDLSQVQALEELINLAANGKIDFSRNTQVSLPASLQKISLFELVTTFSQDVRLTNALHRHIDSGNILPIQSVGEYLSLKVNVRKAKFVAIPNLGSKSFRHLDELVSRTITGELNLSTIATSGNVKLEVSDESPKQTYERIQKIVSVKELACLKERANGKTLEAISKEFGVTRERIRQIQVKAQTKVNSLCLESLTNFSDDLHKRLAQSKDFLSIGYLEKTYELNLQSIKILVLLCGTSLTKEVRFTAEGIWPIFPADQEQDWKSRIKKEIAANLPNAKLKTVVERHKDIPSTAFARILKELGAVVDGSIITTIQRLPMKEKIVLALHRIGRPASPSQISATLSKEFHWNTHDNQVSTTLGDMAEALIVERGVYALYDQLEINQNEVKTLRAWSVNKLNELDRFTSSKVLYSLLKEEHYTLFSKLKSAYTLHGIMQDDERIVVKRGLMLGLRHFSKTSFAPLSVEIYNIVENLGPVSASQIKGELAAHRNILDVSVVTTISQDPRIMKSKRGKYQLVSSFFTSPQSYQTAIVGTLTILHSSHATLSEIEKALFSVNVKEFSANHEALSGFLKTLSFIGNNGPIFFLNDPDLDSAIRKLQEGSEESLDYLSKLTGLKQGVIQEKYKVARKTIILRDNEDTKHTEQLDTLSQILGSFT